MKLNILTLFPQLLESYFDTSITAKAVQKGLLSHQVVDIRSFANDPYRSCDDAPYGGGAGMVMKVEPLAAALASIETPGLVLLPSPAGQQFDQVLAQELSQQEHLTLVCGRYEGIDQRFIDRYVSREISLGDYVLAAGELAAMVIVDAVSRLVPGVINAASLREESFGDGLLEYPHYTRPACFEGENVPPVLLSGHHREIAAWRFQQRLIRTAQRRADLLAKRNLSVEEQQLLKRLQLEGEANATDYS